MPNDGDKYNCEKCSSLDNDRMVQCDRCDQWYHYTCVEVGDDVANYSWSCDVCAGSVPTTSTATTNPPMATQSVITTISSTSQADILYVSTPHRDAPQVKYSTLFQNAIQSSDVFQHRHAMITQHVPVTRNIQHAPAATSNQHVSAETNIHRFSAVAHIPATTNSHHRSSATNSYHLPAAASIQQHMANTSIVDGLCGQQHVHNTCWPIATSAQHPTNNIYQHHYVTGYSQPAASSAYMPPHDYARMQQDTYNNNNYLSSNGNIQNISDWSFSNDGPTPTQIAARQVIPKDLPKLYGDPDEWPLFINCFENSTRVAGFTNAENLIRLQACLKGKALEMVRSRLLLPALVPEVVKTLIMRFGRLDIIIENLMDKVRKSPPVREKLEGLIDIALCVRNICATMEACDLYACMHNPMLVRELLEKIPNQYKINWAMHPRNNNVPVLKAFSDWLYTLAEAASQVVPTTLHKRNGIVNAHYQEEGEESKQIVKPCSSVNLPTISFQSAKTLKSSVSNHAGQQNAKTAYVNSV